jgi:hypothetical protein
LNLKNVNIQENVFITFPSPVKKDYDRIIAAKKTNVSQFSTPMHSTGQFHHKMEGILEDDDGILSSAEEYCNNANRDILIYFACITDH